MAETSRSRVTITLGRRGQVVKRAGPELGSGFSGSHTVAGSKRSVRDRLGDSTDGIQLNSKRQRDAGTHSTTHSFNDVGDPRLCKDDLRFKLMRKNGFKQVQSNGQQNEEDLRSALSRTARFPTKSGFSQVESKKQQNEEDLRSALSRTARFPTASPDMWQHMPEQQDVRKHIPELKDVSVSGRIPSSRSSDLLHPMDPYRNPYSSYKSPYSSWSLDSLRPRSPPHGGLGASRGFSPPRNDEDPRKRPLMRTYDDVRTISYLGKDVLEPSRPLGTVSFMSNSTVPAGSVKPVSQMLPLPPLPTGIVQKSPFTVDEHHTVDSLLSSLGLEKYAIYFKAEEVDMTALRQMGDIDLKELGIPMGPRKKIMLAVSTRSRRQF